MSKQYINYSKRTIGNYEISIDNRMFLSTPIVCLSVCAPWYKESIYIEIDNLADVIDMLKDMQRIAKTHVFKEQEIATRDHESNDELPF